MNKSIPICNVPQAINCNGALRKTNTATFAISPMNHVTNRKILANMRTSLYHTIYLNPAVFL